MPSFTFKVVTRMVIVEVVVRDTADNPVRDLTAKDLRVFETIGASKKLPEKIASFRSITEPLTQSADRSKGIVLGWLHKSYCALTGTYELSYYLSPETRKDGLHRISVATTRDDLTLYFRPGYKIEADKPAEVQPGELDTEQTHAQLQKRQALEAERVKHPELELALIACYDTLNTTTFQLGLQKLKSKAAEYEFVVPATYFASLPAEEHRPTQLDFSLCTFEYNGHPLLHFEGMVQVGTDSEDYESSSSRGFAHAFTFDPQQPGVHALSARLVVRDRNTGALGAGEILLLPLGPDYFPAPIPEGQTNSLFGTTTRDTPLALCGDVYQLPPWTTHLPRFSEIDALAPIYTTSLGVYSRFFTLGIPGVTSRTEWFGVNYWGVFGVDRPGKYEFDLLSDDGAKVYIDEKLIVSDDTLHSPQGSRGNVRLAAGPHDIRVSYFQGPRTEVALVLLVKPPGRSWRLFDTRDFPNPEDPSAQRKKLPLPQESPLPQE
ncbi:MAG: PA14 domain-containing protein [Candidatus Sulfotelmatobacter sp.]